jgi:hypothetical protein
MQIFGRSTEDAGIAGFGQEVNCKTASHENILAIASHAEWSWAT